ncbi:hypothetical protein ACKF11_09400 [Methylobacillus sp. Pita2]|uniref:hypothetical protein n=1 Tax=Methylobacillus sp. Pita2 TaxID=3383245 RepID=UPI0038B4755C
MRILFSPATASNQYIANMIALINSLEPARVETQSRLNPGFILRNTFNRYDYIIINWLENSLVGKNKSLDLFSVARFLFKFFIYRIMGRKLIFVRHNIYPHALKGRQAAIATWIIETAIKLSTISVVHSGHLESERAKYIPHPLYKVNAQPKSQGSDYYVIFGRIVEYKAIHKLLESWGSQRLVIAGLVEDQAYAAKLQSIIQSRGLSNVELRAEFLSEAEAEQLVANSKGLILSHCDADMIVSGSFFFAASLGVPVFAMATPFFQWLKHDQGYQGLHVFTSLQAMTAGISAATAEEKITISASAQRLFGNDEVAKALSKVLH